jgi:anhydro-N-acetylmuramic acid kinase
MMFRVVGVMSGTSLDGLDLALCAFEEKAEGRFSGAILKAVTYPYDTEWQRRLRYASLLSGRELMKLHADYGVYIGGRVREFLKTELENVLLVASHGHTIYHEPGRGFTFQLGSGAHLAACCGLPAVCDFRSGDVAHGGQGAPLVPLGEQILFPEFGAFLNLGGFANVSVHRGGHVRAWDVCAANYVLNALSRRLGLAYDAEGVLAASGHLNERLLIQLENQEYYRRPPPKSLGSEDAEAILNAYLLPDIPIRDILHTWCHHAARRIVFDLRRLTGSRPLRVMVTGGGARNTFLMSCLKNYGAKENLEFVIPDDNLIDFKEAYIFALLGLMRWLQRPTTLASVTGAQMDSVTGAVYLP